MPAPASYDNRKEQLVHQLIEAIFSGQEFDRFCLYYYPTLYYRFSPDMGNGSKIRILIKYAVRRRQLGKLVNSIQSTKPGEYRAFVQRVQAAAKIPEPAPLASSPVSLPDRTIRVEQHTGKKPLVSTWALLIVLIVILFFASEPLYLIIKPLYADDNPTIRKAFIIVEKVIRQETPDIPAQDEQAVTAKEADRTRDRPDDDDGQDDLANMDEPAAETFPQNQDTDGDGLDDQTEIDVLKTNPLSPDTDSDGLRDDDEMRWGFNPLSWDTDGDGTPDSTEANPGQMLSATLTPVPIPGPRFKEATYSVNEQEGKATITIQLVAVAENQVTIHYTTLENGTATAGEDYTTTSGRLVFNPGQINGIFSIPIINDSIHEPIETVGLELSSSAQTNLGPNTSQSTLMVIDDDIVGIRFSQLQPSLTLLQADPPRYLINENQQAIIDVELTAPTSQQIRIEYATEDGSASAGEDYIPVKSTLTFNPGETKQRFGVRILPDNQPEDPEVIILTLSLETEADISRAELVIVDSN